MDELAAILDFPGAELGATAADVIAFFWLFVCWAGYNVMTDRRARSGQSLVGVMHQYRLRWMERMLERDNRILDINIVGTHLRSDALFASTSIFIMAGVVAILGALDPARELLSELSFVVSASRAMWEVKLLLLLMIFVYAFFKFAWSMRQFNFSTVLIGTAPLKENVSATDMAEYPKMTALVITRGADNFNRGLRAYYFGLAALGWFVHPWLFMAATVWVILVLYRREFRSITQRTLKREMADDDP